jgi:hypothetical protein
MKTLTPAIIMFILLTCFPLGAQEKAAEEKQNPLLSEIAASIDTYKTRTVTLRLKLKHVDRIFEKIIFYDRKNHDIEFDYSAREMKKKLAADMLNVHEGLEYNVTFTVRDRGSAGNIVADLKGFKPVIFDAMP